MRPTETVGRVLQLSMAKTENEREEGEEKSQVRGGRGAAAGLACLKRLEAPSPGAVGGSTAEAAAGMEKRGICG